MNAGLSGFWQDFGKWGLSPRKEGEMMHIGHNEDEIDHEDLALRHYGAGLVREREGSLAEAEAEFRAALELNPDLEVAKKKLASLSLNPARL